MQKMLGLGSSYPTRLISSHTRYLFQLYPNRHRYFITSSLLSLSSTLLSTPTSTPTLTSTRSRGFSSTFLREKKNSKKKTTGNLKTGKKAKGNIDERNARQEDEFVLPFDWKEVRSIRRMDVKESSVNVVGDTISASTLSSSPAPAPASPAPVSSSSAPQSAIAEAPLHTSTTPYYNPEDSALISALHELNKKSPKLVRSTVFNVALKDGNNEGGERGERKAKSVELRSWKMNEFKYYDIPSPFPTLARGLFTRELSDRQLGIEKAQSEESTPKIDDPDYWKQKKFQIVVRGYDKFFNIGEVPWTTWASIEAHTSGPYTLSLKSNGCIIFIAAVTPTQLVVTSKHSLGANENAALSHAVVGERWLRKYIEGKGKTEKDMAKELWERNLTAVAELCDDSFEEHVLPYSPEKTGLHLHGLNIRSKQFATLPTPVVDDFAERWGFIKTATKVCNTVAEVKSFSDTCAQNGEWNGEAVEGFVVRCIVRDVPTSSSSIAPTTSSNKESGSKSPYKPNGTFFFKIKFDEPYMMYRDWREVTKTLLAQYAKSPGVKLTEGMVAKNKMKRKETVEYVRWVIREIEREPREFDGFAKGHGIIRTRERFLKEFGEKGGVVEGLEEGKGAGAVGEGEERGDLRWVVVPVAIPGCGKTAVSVALKELFGWGHTQSDDVAVKKSAPVFLKNVVGLLNENRVVVADKNNHLIQHRAQLREATRHLYPPVRLLALNWSLSHLPRTTAHRICSDRILNRGSNHQTLTADTSMKKSHEEVVWMFLNKGEELSENEVDRVVEMEVEDTLEEGVKRAVEGIVKVMKFVKVPSEEEIKRACDVARGYVPGSVANSEVGKEKGKGKAAKKGVEGGVDPRYFAMIPEIDVVRVLDERLCKTDVDEGVRRAYLKMKSDKRVAGIPHITIVHSKGRKADQIEERGWEIASRICEIDGVKEKPPMMKGRVGRVVWDGRVMALVVDEIGVDEEGVRVEKREGGGGEEYVEIRTTRGDEFVNGLPLTIKNRLHVTVGTKDGSVSPVEAKGVVEELKRREAVGGERAGEGLVRGEQGGMDIWVYDVGEGGEGVEFRARVKGMFS